MATCAKQGVGEEAEAEETADCGCLRHCSWWAGACSSPRKLPAAVQAARCPIVMPMKHSHTHLVGIKGKLGVAGVGVAVGIVQRGARLQLGKRPEDDGKASRLAVLQARDGDVALPCLQAGQGGGGGQVGRGSEWGRRSSTVLATAASGVSCGFPCAAGPPPPVRPPCYPHYPTDHPPGHTRAPPQRSGPAATAGCEGCPRRRLQGSESSGPAPSAGSRLPRWAALRRCRWHFRRRLGCPRDRLDRPAQEG